MTDKTRFVDIIRQRLAELRMTQAELARAVGVTEKNISVWLDPLSPTLPTQKKDTILPALARAVALDAQLQQELFAAGGLLYQPPAADAAAPAPTAAPDPPAGGIFIGKVEATNVAMGGMTIYMPGGTAAPAPGDAPLTVLPRAGAGLNACLSVESERLCRVQISYALHVHRLCTLLQLDFTLPTPGLVEDPAHRQLHVGGQPLAFAPNLRLHEGRVLTPGVYEVLHSKCWRWGAGGAAPAPAAVALQIDTAEAGQVGSRLLAATLPLAGGETPAPAAATDISPDPALVRAMLRQQLADRRTLLLAYENELVLASGRERATLSVHAQQERDAIAALEKRLDAMGPIP